MKITLEVQSTWLPLESRISENKIKIEAAKFVIQVPDIHRIITLPFTKIRCFIGYATIKKRSMDIEVIDTNDTPPIQKIKKLKIGYEKVLGAIRESKQSKLVIQSETERFITRYVPEFLKHFRGSLIKATRSKIFETTPNVPIMIPSKLTYVNSLPMLTVALVSAMCCQ